MMMSVNELPEKITIDAESSRLAIATKNKNSTAYRLWCIARLPGNGRIARERLLGMFAHVYSEKHLKNALEAGNGVFWTLAGDYVFPANIEKVSSRLISQAHEIDPRLVETKRPGNRPIVVDTAIFFETTQKYHAELYNAWHKENGHTMSRFVLNLLFQVTTPTLRRWEALTNLTVIHQYAQTNDLLNPAIPDHARSYIAKGENGLEIRNRWQVSNYYRSSYSTHAHQGQSRKVRSAVNSRLPRALISQARTRKRLYFADRENAKRIMRKHGIDERYLLLGNRDGIHVYDLITNRHAAPNTRLYDDAKPVDVAMFWKNRQALVNGYNRSVEINVTPCFAYTHETHAHVQPTPATRSDRRASQEQAPNRGIPAPTERQATIQPPNTNPPATVKLARDVINKAYEQGDNFGRKAHKTYHAVLSRKTGKSKAEFAAAIVATGWYQLPHDLGALKILPVAKPTQTDTKPSQGNMLDTPQGKATPSRRPNHCDYELDCVGIRQ